MQLLCCIKRVVLKKYLSDFLQYGFLFPFYSFSSPDGFTATRHPSQRCFEVIRLTCRRLPLQHVGSKFHHYPTISNCMFPGSKKKHSARSRARAQAACSKRSVCIQTCCVFAYTDYYIHIHKHNWPLQTRVNDFNRN